MRGRKVWAIGGFLAGGLLIVLGAGALYTSINGYQLVHDELSQEQIVGSDDMAPTAIEQGISEAGLQGVSAPDCDVAGEQIDSGSEAKCFAEYMRIHALEGTGGLTYAEMGRYQSADNPADPKGTNDEAAAAKDEAGKPVSNGQRNLWVTETALATALNVSYMAEQLSYFAIVVGIALLVTGIGLILLAYAVFAREPAARPTPAPSSAPAA